MDLGSEMLVAGVVTQPRAQYSTYWGVYGLVTRYTVEHSLDDGDGASHYESVDGGAEFLGPTTAEAAGNSDFQKTNVFAGGAVR